MVERLGWYRKFRVERIEGDPEKHLDCDYFVLDLTHDPMARFSALDYARQCEYTDPQLASDIRAKVSTHRGY